MTYFRAALTILAYADRPLTVAELTSVAVADGLVRPRGRTPDRTMSSVLYRRMAQDPDAPVVSNGGRFWLRGRPLPAASGNTLRPAIRKVHRGSGAPRRASVAAPRPATVLPPPPLRLPSAGDQPLPAQARGLAPGLPRQERAVARLAERLGTLARKITPLWDGADAWEAERTASRIVAPLLTLLGYRRIDRQHSAHVRGRVVQLLLIDHQPVILSDTFRAGHTLTDADARSTIGRALAQHSPWAALTNGHEVRVYATSLPDAAHEPASALVLRVDPFAWSDDASLLATAHLLWLLSRAAIASGALAAYLAARAVGAALLSAFDDPNSDLVRALATAVSTATGLDLPGSELARHARLAVRMVRDREGAPLPEDAAVVAAVGATRFVPAAQHDTVPAATPSAVGMAAHVL